MQNKDVIEVHLRISATEDLYQRFLDAKRVLGARSNVETVRILLTKGIDMLIEQ